MGTAKRQFAKYKAMRDRLALVEKTLMAVWRWSTFDGVNVEALQAILRRADPDAAVHAALDALIRNEED